MNKKIPSIPAIGIIALIALLVGTVVVLIGLQIKNSIKITLFGETQDETAGWKTYRNEEYGFEIKYPDDIFKLDNSKTVLYHSLSGIHMYSEKDGSDLGIAKDIVVTFKNDADECNRMEADLKDVAVFFESANLRGQKYELGAEGLGVVYYCLKNAKDENVFLIERRFLNEAYSTELIKQADYISSQRQKEVFDKMLSTFRFID